MTSRKDKLKTLAWRLLAIGQNRNQFQLLAAEVNYIARPQFMDLFGGVTIDSEQLVVMLFQKEIIISELNAARRLTLGERTLA